MIESLRFAGIARASNFLKNGNSNRKKTLLWYSGSVCLIHIAFLIFIGLETRDESIIKIIAALLLIFVLLNDCFNNSFIIVYNLEVTIVPSFSLLLSSSPAMTPNIQSSIWFFAAVISIYPKQKKSSQDLKVLARLMQSFQY